MALDPYANSSRVLGPDGRPARLNDSDRLKAIIGAYESYLRLSFRLAPYNPDQLIGSKGYKIFDDQYNMACISAPLDTMRDAVLYKGLQVHPFVEEGEENPAPEAQELAKALQYALDNIQDDARNSYDPHDMVWELLYAVHTGVRVIEKIGRLFEDGPYKGKMGWAMFAAKPNRQIGWDLDEKTLGVNAITSYTPLTGYQFGIPVQKVIRYTYKPVDGLPYGSPTGRRTYRHTWSIDNMMQFRNVAAQKFAMGFLKATAPKAGLDEAQAAVDKAAMGTSLVVPQGTEVDLLETNGMGLQAIEAIIASERQQCALAYLYSVLTSGEGSHGATSAGSDVQQDQQQFGMAGLRRGSENVLNRQLVRPWVIDNFGQDAVAYAPRLSLGDWDEADTEKLGNTVEGLVDKGILHPDDPQILKKLKFAPTPPNLKADLQQERERKRNLEERTATAKMQKSNAKGKSDGK